MPQPIAGCDLSRAFIDLHCLPAGKVGQIANTPEAIASWLDTLERDFLVIFEATSGCGGDLIAALAERSHPFSRVNPRQARELLAPPASSPRPIGSMPVSWRGWEPHSLCRSPFR